MGATVQKGTSLIIGFAGNTFTGTIMEDFTTEATGEVTPIKDEDNATITKLVADLGKKISFSALIKTASAPALPAKGSTITINSVAFCVEDASIKYSRGVALISVSAIKEDSMTYSA